MTRHRIPCRIPLPRGWPQAVKSTMLHVISLAQYALAYTRSWALNSQVARVRSKAESDQLRQHAALLAEELRVKDARMMRMPAQMRPHYLPADRMSILEVRAAHGWSMQQTAETFLVTTATIASWMSRLDEQGADALVQNREPVNRFPDLVRYAVQRLKTLCPALGKVKIAEVLCRAGLHLGATTVGRILKESPRPTPRKASAATARALTAKRPESRLAHRSNDRAHGRRLLGTMVAVCYSATLAVRLVACRDCRSLLSTCDGHRSLLATADVTCCSRLCRKGDCRCERDAEASHLRQGQHLLVQGLQTLVSEQDNPPAVRCGWAAWKHRRD